MPSKDIFSEKKRFSRRQVIKRPYNLTSQAAENDQGTSLKTVAGSRARATPKQKEKYTNDFNVSSPLVPLDEQDENYPPEHHSMDTSEKNSLSQESVNKGSVLSNKDSQNLPETLPIHPIEFSYLSSTPLPGKQQLRRQRPFTAASEVNRCDNTSGPDGQTRSSFKAQGQEHSSFNNQRQKRSSAKASQPIKPVKANSYKDSRDKSSDISDESPTGEGKRKKKIHATVPRDSAVSIDRLTKALSEKKLLKRREKQNEPGSKVSGKNEQVKEGKEKSVRNTSTVASRSKQFSSLPRDSLHIGSSESDARESSDSDASRDVGNRKVKNTKDTIVDEVKSQRVNKKQNKETNHDGSRSAEAEKSSSKIISNKVSTKKMLTRQNEINIPRSSQETGSATRKTVATIGDGPQSKGKKEGKGKSVMKDSKMRNIGQKRKSESGSEDKNDEDSKARKQQKGNKNRITISTRNGSKNRKCSESENEKEELKARRQQKVTKNTAISGTRKASKKKSSENDGESASDGEISRKERSRNRSISSNSRSRRISSSSESETEIQTENIQTQKQSAANVKQMKQQEIGVRRKKIDEVMGSVRQNGDISSSDSDCFANNQRKATERGRKDNEKVTSSKTNNHTTIKHKQATDAVPKKKARFSDTTKDDIGPDCTMLVWSSDDLKRKKGDIVDIDVVLNCFSEVLETQLDVCESEIEQRAVRTLEKYLTQDITNMIRNVQSVNSLQKQVKKKEQELKQKKNDLISLQDRRLELEEKDAPTRDQSSRNNNMKDINSFLRDLQELVAMC